MMGTDRSQCFGRTLQFSKHCSGAVTTWLNNCGAVRNLPIPGSPKRKSAFIYLKKSCKDLSGVAHSNQIPASVHSLMQYLKESEELMKCQIYHWGRALGLGKSTFKSGKYFKGQENILEIQS